MCRGHDYERLEAFQQRMLGEFPQAIAMQHPNQPDEAILQCDAQCKTCTAVKDPEEWSTPPRCCHGSRGLSTFFTLDL